jgi:hypothetical protein
MSHCKLITIKSINKDNTQSTIVILDGIKNSAVYDVKWCSQECGDICACLDDWNAQLMVNIKFSSLHEGSMNECSDLNQ